MKKVWRLVLVSALTVVVLSFAPPARSAESDCFEVYNPYCFQPGGDCEGLCQCLGFSTGICTLPYPNGNCLCWF